MTTAGTPMIGVGSLTAGITATVDCDGAVHRGRLRLGWRVRSGNDWLVPGQDAPARRTRPHPAPIVRTALRIPGGDAVERVYAVGDGDTAVTVVEVENDSPEAIAVGWTVEAPGAVVAGEDGVRVDGTAVLAYARRPGAIEDGSRVVFAVPHRTTVRVALVERSDVDLRALAGPDAVERGWDAVLDRGLRTELPEPLQSEVDAARADLLLAPPSAEAFAALEAWGFDAEATRMWARLGMRARRAARRGAPGGVLGGVRGALVRERDHDVDLLPGMRAAWLGHPLAAHDLPLVRGTCSFALRWHGARPALLWEVPAGTTVRASALDPSWSSREPAGEALLAEPAPALLPMGDAPNAAAPRDAATADAPEQFS